MSQSNSANGYIILNDGSKKVVFIKGKNWINNPDKVKVGSTENGEERIYTIDELKEFKTDEGVVYRRAKVLIDISSDAAEKFSKEREPKFEETTIFLKTLVDGEASLYQYITVGYVKFFYQLNNQDIEQLIYKRYIKNDKVLPNNEYKQTLSNIFDCEGLKQSVFKNLKYSSYSLENIFDDYNDCIGTGGNYVQQSAIKLAERKPFSVRAKLGLRFNSLEFESDGNIVDLGSKVGEQLAFEGEYAIKSTDFALSLLIEGAYFAYNDNIRISTENDTFDTYNIEYNAIDISLGARYSLPLNDKNRLFVNVLYGFPLQLIDSLGTSVSENITTFDSKSIIAYGAGAEFNKISIEFRLQSNQDLLTGLDSSYKNFSVNLGYKF